MKIRNGFVSNSSTSSFLIVGFKGEVVAETDEQYDEFVKMIDELGIEWLTDDGPSYFGKVIFDNPDDSGPEEVQEVDTLSEYKKVKKIVDKNSKILSKYIKSNFQIKTYAGTRSC